MIFFLYSSYRNYSHYSHYRNYSHYSYYRNYSHYSHYKKNSYPLPLDIPIRTLFWEVYLENGGAYVIKKRIRQPK